MTKTLQALCTAAALIVASSAFSVAQADTTVGVHIGMSDHMRMRGCADGGMMHSHMRGCAGFGHSRRHHHWMMKKLHHHMM